jgi:hypothetical protein
MTNIAHAPFTLQETKEKKTNFLFKINKIILKVKNEK